MTAADGYRLKVKEVRELAVVMDGFRSDALRLLARSYGRLVAADAVRRADLHVLGKPDPSSADSPLSDANLTIQRAYAVAEGRPAELDLNCELAIYLLGDAVLARFISGNEEYRRAWESRREVHRWGWSETSERPKGISEQNWKVREICWRNALSKPGLGSGLRLVLIEDGLPQIGWGGIRRYLPSMDDRVRAVAPAVLASKGRNAAEMTAEALTELRRRLAVSLPRELTKDHLTSYPSAHSPRARPPQRAKAEGKDDAPVKSAQIDHADVVQSSDGRVFVAVPYVGLDTEDRVFVQVADHHIAITQNATQWGYVSDVPRLATDLLRDCKSVILVEVERKDGRRLLRAKHVAIVKDISLVENVSRTLGRWRSKGLAREKDDGEIKGWDSEQSTTSES